MMYAYYTCVQVCVRLYTDLEIFLSFVSMYMYMYNVMFIY